MWKLVTIGASFASRPTVILWPSHATIQAMATACAMIACADGNATNKERRSFLRFLHHHGALERYGRAPCIAAFNVALADGITWPQEIALLEVIRNRIGLGYPPGWGSQ
jgi:tellurite resistance protein